MKKSAKHDQNKTKNDHLKEKANLKYIILNKIFNKIIDILNKNANNTKILQYGYREEPQSKAA